MTKRNAVVAFDCNGKDCKLFTEFTIEPDDQRTIAKRLENTGWLTMGDLHFCPACKPKSKEIT